MLTLLSYLVGGFIATVDQYWIAYHVTILFTVLLVLECFFLPETLYPRDLIIDSGRESNDGEFDMKRTKKLGYLVSIDLIEQNITEYTRS